MLRRPDKLAEYNSVVNNLELTWDILIYSAFYRRFYDLGGYLFLSKPGKKDWPTARIVRQIPLIGAYLRDLGFSDSMLACAR